MPLEHFRARMAANAAMETETRERGTQEILPALPAMQSSEITDPSVLGPPDPLPTMLGRVLHAAEMAFEPLRRTTQAARETILWGAQKTTTEGFKRRVSAGLKGDLRMSSAEFGQILLGRTKWEAMRRTPAIPGWLPPITDPEMSVVRKIKTHEVSLADMWTLGAEVWADPFTYLALTPPGLGVKLTSYASKVPGGAGVARVLNAPWKASTTFAETLFGPNKGLLGFVNLGRQPEDVLTGAQRVIFEDFKTSTDTWLRATHEAWEISKGVLSPTVKLGSEADRKIGAALWGKRVALTAEEAQTAKQTVALINNHLDELVKARPGILKELGLKAPHPGQMQLFGPNRALTLDKLFPSMVGKQSIPIDIWQSWSVDNLGKVFLGLTKEQALAKGLSVNIANTPMEKFSAIESVRDLLFVIKKKQHLEPSLLSHAPKPGRVGESVAISTAGRWQRRYVTDLINSFTGNSRGRKQIEFDYHMAEIWEKLSSTPNGQRVERLMKRLGYGNTRDGFVDMSPTAKIAGLWTGSIVQNVLGLRLKSALINSTQTLNFAVSRGLPQTVKGMMMFSKPGVSMLRKEANLMGDYKALFAEDTWIRGAGKIWSEIIMGPFNVMENIIRGTGFHVGMDQWMRKNAAGRTFQQVLANPKAREEMAKFAHFESLNGAFLYGILGRAPALSNPLLKPATALLSYPFKQAEFLRREIVKDGSAMMRFIGLHGWLIERSNQWAGVATEDFLGWGFKPMTKSFGGIPVLTSPPMQLLLDTTQGIASYARGDRSEAERFFKSAKANLPLVLSPIPFPWLATRELLGDPTTGKPGLVEMWRTKRREIGETQVPIPRSEVVKNWLVGRSTTQKMRSDLESRMRKAEKQIDFELDTRARNVGNALDGANGDTLGEAYWRAVQPIVVEGKAFYPEAEMLESRLMSLVEKKTLSRDILAMKDSGFLSQLFLWSQLELLDRVSKETGQ